MSATVPISGHRQYQNEAIPQPPSAYVQADGQHVLGTGGTGNVQNQPQQATNKDKYSKRTKILVFVCILLMIMMFNGMFKKEKPLDQIRRMEGYVDALQTFQNDMAEPITWIAQDLEQIKNVLQKRGLLNLTNSRKYSKLLDFLNPEKHG